MADGIKGDSLWITNPAVYRKIIQKDQIVAVPHHPIPVADHDIQVSIEWIAGDSFCIARIGHCVCRQNRCQRSVEIAVISRDLKCVVIGDIKVSIQVVVRDSCWLFIGRIGSDQTAKGQASVDRLSIEGDFKNVFPVEFGDFIDLGIGDNEIAWLPRSWFMVSDSGGVCAVNGIWPCIKILNQRNIAGQ